MSFKLSELLNPAPSSEAAPKQPQMDLQPCRSDTSPPLAETHRTARLPTPPLQLAHVAGSDRSPPDPPSAHLVIPVEPSTPLKHGSSPTLHQYHLSPIQGQARHPSMVSVPQGPPAALAPILPQYDVSPPRTRLAGLEMQNTVASAVAGMRSADSDSVEIEEHLPKCVSDQALAQAYGEPGQAETGELQPVLGYNASEEEIAALRLAPLDGAQEEDADSVVNSETQAAPELGPVPDVNPTSRQHKVPTSRPSEGSSDKRFLCYICIKLFTRRRSVRDHIKKIHNDTNFDMSRAIEVTVDPETGQSLTPLAELVSTLPVPAGGQETPRVASYPASRASSVEANAFSTPATVGGKKRPAPDTPPAQATALKKKGTAKPKPVITISKKVKPEIDSAREANAATAFRSPSATPVSSRGSKTPAAARPKKQPSMSLASSPALSERVSIAPATDNEAEDEGEQACSPAGEVENNEAVDDDDEIFCICRKGDNHTWMIGCDGGCEDWFHGKCVNIHERDGDLIDKYICPHCEDKGRGQTTWKRMCRRKQCRKPARVLAEPPSKYCSEECKKRFWVGMIEKSDPNALMRQDGLTVIGSKLHRREAPSKKRRRLEFELDKGYNEMNDNKESEYQEGGMRLSSSWRKKKGISPSMNKSCKNDFMDRHSISSDDEPLLPTNGGALSVGDIKMMLNQARSVDEIRKLGQKPPTPPYTSDIDACYPDTERIDGVHASTQKEQKPFPYNSEEQAHLERLSVKKRELDYLMQFLRDQEKFLGIIKTRSAAIVDEMDVPRAKNVCGFDARLSWSNAEFEDWRTGTVGRAALEEGKIGDPDPSGGESTGAKEERSEPEGIIDGVGNGLVGDDDDDDDDRDEEEGFGQRTTIVRGICIRNKCPRHREWRRLLASEYKFEEEGVRRQMRKVEMDGKEIRDRAAMRVLCEQD